MKTPVFGRNRQAILLCSLILTTPLASLASTCVDTGIVGDGWGWDGTASCKLPITISATECIDTTPENDGWGWDGIDSCALEGSIIAGACKDTPPYDDDWGWDGIDSCLLNSPPPSVSKVTRITFNDTGQELDGELQIENHMSADGRFLLFGSTASNVISTNPEQDSFADVFLRDIVNGTVTKISASASNTENTNNSYAAGISADGRYSLLTSYSKDIHPKANGSLQIYLFDSLSASLTLISKNNTGQTGSGNSGRAKITADGSTVYFTSRATNLIAGAPKNRVNFYQYNAALQTLALMDIGLDYGPASDTFATIHDITPDGRYLLIRIVPNFGKTEVHQGLYLYDSKDSSTQRITGQYGAYYSYVSDDGLYIAYSLTYRDSSARTRRKITHVDMLSGSSKTVVSDADTPSVSPNDFDAVYLTDISPNGRQVIFTSNANTGTDNLFNVRAKDLDTGAYSLLSPGLSTAAKNEYTGAGKFTDNSQQIYFYSNATHVVDDDNNYRPDIFITNYP